MKRYEQVPVPATTEKKLVEHSCELCKKDMRSQTCSSFDTQEATIEVRRGNHWPEGSAVKRLEADICVDCTVKMIVPFLEEKGVRFRIIDESGSYYDPPEMKEPGVEFDP